MKFLTTLFICSLSFWSFSQEWVEVSNLPNFFQTDHSFAFGINGKGYIVSGNSNQGRRDDFYEYDPIADEWTQKDDFPGGERGFAIGDIMDGKAYFGFGTDGFDYLNDLWVFDPATDEWTELASCECSGRVHPAMVAIDGKIYVGLGGNDFNLNDWWEYDVATDSWEQKANLPDLPRHHPYQFGIDGYAYAGFGHGSGFISNEWYRYDPATDQWDQMEDLPEQGRVAGTQFTYNGKGYALSGEGEDHQTMSSGEFWEYDPVADSWTELPAHPGQSRWAPASFVVNDEVYLINGPVRSGFSFTYQPQVYKFALGDNVAIREEMKENQITVYPNPFTDKVQFVLDDNILNPNDFRMEVYDAQYRLVETINYYSAEIDLSFLNAGFYHLKVSTGNQVLHSELIKQ